MLEIEFKLRAPEEELLKHFPEATPASLIHHLESAGIAAASALGFSVLGRRRVLNNDTYYDTANNELATYDVSVRVREAGGEKELTIKLPVKSEPGPFVRQELSTSLSRRPAFEISGATLNTLFSSLPLTSVRFDRQSIGDLFGRVIDEPLEPKLLVDNNRVVVDLEIGSHNFLAMYFDLYTFATPQDSRNSPPFVELELEYILDGVKSSYDRIRNLSLRLQADLGLKPSERSKYQEGLEWMMTHNEATPA